MALTSLIGVVNIILNGLWLDHSGVTEASHNADMLEVWMMTKLTLGIIAVRKRTFQ